MILTFTPNPSIDTTLSLGEPLKRGSVHRLSSRESIAGGKGINVSRAVAKAGLDTRALFPAGDEDPFVELVRARGIDFENFPINDPVRVNTAVTEPDGTTTKLNSLGPQIDDETVATLEEALFQQAEGQDWVVLAGSLPPGAPVDWYATLTQKLRARFPELRVAVDTSDAPMEALGQNFDKGAPHLIKPNAKELGQLVGIDGEGLEEKAIGGDFSGVAAAARKAFDAGVEYVLVTLGPAGGLLACQEGIFVATPPPITVASTVGAGDSTLAGFIIGWEKGLSAKECLRHGIAYGSAATSLPGTMVPGPEQLDLERTVVTAYEN